MTAPVLEVSWGAATHPGAVRAHNEDSFLAEPPIFLVADGMGGHDAGAAASAAVVSAFGRLAGQGPVEPGLVFEAATRADELVRAVPGAGGNPPGSTLAGVALAVQGSHPCWHVFNIGDSRAYRLDADGFEQITVDHSQTQALIDAGLLTSSDAARHPSRSVITRALGAGLPARSTLDQWLLIARTGDRMLICSDGLTGELTDEFVAATLLAVPDPAQAAQALVTAAVEAGARDNVTAVVVDAVFAGAGAGTDGPEASDPDDLWGPTRDGDPFPSEQAADDDGLDQRHTLDLSTVPGEDA